MQTSLAKAAHIARISDLDHQHGDPSHLKNVINYSVYHCRTILKFSSKSAYNLLR